jgi:hypothetical protein
MINFSDYPCLPFATLAGYPYSYHSITLLVNTPNNIPIITVITITDAMTDICVPSVLFLANNAALSIIQIIAALTIQITLLMP